LTTYTDIAAAAETNDLLYALLKIYQYRHADPQAMQELIAVCERRAAANHFGHAAEYTALAALAQHKLAQLPPS
jgi:hypothetical protein